MMEIEIIRTIAATVAAFLLGWALYVAAYTRHKNSIRNEANIRALAAKDADVSGEQPTLERYRLEKTAAWYTGYRLALMVLFFASAGIGWALGWAIGQEHILTPVQDCAVTIAGALIGGLIVDKYVIHPIADGCFFERVEDPIVQRFLQDADVPVVQVKDEKDQKDPFETWSFQDKVALLEQLKKSL